MFVVFVFQLSCFCEFRVMSYLTCASSNTPWGRTAKFESPSIRYSSDFSRLSSSFNSTFHNQMRGGSVSMNVSKSRRSDSVHWQITRLICKSMSRVKINNLELARGVLILMLHFRSHFISLWMGIWRTREVALSWSPRHRVKGRPHSLTGQLKPLHSTTTPGQVP